MSYHIKYVKLFYSPVSEYYINHMENGVKVGVNPPRRLIPNADQRLQMNGELIDFVKETGHYESVIVKQIAGDNAGIELFIDLQLPGEDCGWSLSQSQDFRYLLVVIF